MQVYILLVSCVKNVDNFGGKSLSQDRPRLDVVLVSKAQKKLFFQAGDITAFLLLQVLVLSVL